MYYIMYVSVQNINMKYVCFVQALTVLIITGNKKIMLNLFCSKNIS